jgi:hypothetical protein
MRARAERILVIKLLHRGWRQDEAEALALHARCAPWLYVPLILGIMLRP